MNGLKGLAKNGLIIISVLVMLISAYYVFAVAPQASASINVVSIKNANNHSWFYWNYSDADNDFQNGTVYTWFINGTESWKETSLVGYWKLDSDTLDSSYNGNNGTIISTTGLPAPNDGVNYTNLSKGGIVKGAIAFTNRFQADPTLSMNITENITISGWVYAGTAFGTNAMVLKQGPVAFPYVMGINVDGDLVFNITTTGPVSHELKYNMSLLTSQAHFVAGTYDGATMSLYFDGVLVNSTAVTDPIIITPAPLFLAANGFNGLGVMGGTSVGDVLYDEIKIYNRTLSPIEIMQEFHLMEYGQTEKENVTGTPGEDVPIVLYHFDELSGTSTRDYFGNTSGQIIGTNIGFANGLFGSNAISINTTTGGGQVVNVSFNQNLNLTRALTIEAWIKPSAQDAARGLIVAKAVSANNDFSWNLALNGSGTGVGFLFFGLTNQTDVSSAVPEGTIAVRDYAWTHVAATWDGVTVRVYVNGTLDLEREVQGTLNMTNSNLSIGSDEFGSNTFNGTIEEVAIYNRALSELEINQSYTRGFPHFGYNTSSLPHGSQLSVLVEPSDSTGFGTAVMSQNATVNIQPEVQSVGLLPTTAYEHSTFNASAIALDNDTDTLRVTFRWMKNNVSIYNSTVSSVTNGTNVTNILLTGNFSHFDNVTVEVQIEDPYINSTWVNSSAVQVSNSVPEVMSVGLLPSTAYEHTTFNASVIAIDNDTDTTSVIFRWIVNNLSVYNSTVSSVTNGTNVTNILATGNFSHFDNVSVEIQIDDIFANSTFVNSSVVQVSNTVPQAVSVGIIPSPAFNTSILNASFVSLDNDTDNMTVTFRWYVNNLSVYNTSLTSTNGTNVTNILTRGNYTRFDNVTVEIEIVDNWSSSVFVNSTIQISNTVPVVTSVGLLPSTAYEHSTFNASVIAIDNDTDTMTVTFKWMKNNLSVYNSSVASVTNGTNVTNILLTGNFTHFDNVSVEIQIDDTFANSTFVNSSAVQVSNSVPEVMSVGLLPSTAYEHSTFNASVIAIDNDTDTMSVIFRWMKNNVSVYNSTVSSITNGTNVTNILTTGNYSHFDNVTVEIQIDDTFANSTFVNSSAVQVSNSVPEVMSVGLLPSTAYEHTTFNASVIAIDNDTDTTSVIFRWIVNNLSVYNSTVSSVSNGTNVTNILATGNFTHFDNVSVEIQIDDTFANSTFVNSSVVQVSNTVPQAISLGLLPSTAYEHSTFNASVVALDNDTNPMNVTFRWMKNNVSIYNSTVSSVTNGTNITNILLTGNFSHFDNVTVEIKIIDNWSTSTFVNSSSIQVSNSVPEVMSVGLLPSTAYEHSTFNASVVALDNDTNPMNVTFRWMKNNVSIYNSTVASVTNGTNVTNILATGNFSHFDNVTVEVQIQDNWSSSTFVNSSSVQVSNSVPVATSIGLLPSSGYANQTFNASVIAIDNDTDTMTVNFTWIVNNATVVNNSISSVSNGTNVTNTINVGNYSRYDNVTVEIKIFDNFTTSVYVNTTTVQILNSIPSVNVSISPTSPSASSTLNASVVVSDGDSDATNVTFRWIKNSNIYVYNQTVASDPGTITAILTSGNFTNSDSIKVEVYADDGLANSSYVNATAVSIPAASTPSSSTPSGGSTVKPLVQEIRTLAQSISGLARLDFSKPDQLAIKNVVLNLVSTATSISVAVKEAKEPSVGAPIASNVGGVYKYIEITKTTVGSDIKSAAVQFVIEKKWLSDNGFSKNTVGLNRLVNNVWTKLQTKYVSEDSTYFIFEAETPGFSTFAISAEKESIPQNTTVIVEPNKPSISIDLIEGQVVKSQSLLLKFSVSNLKLVESSVNKDGEGHIALYLDNNDFITVTTDSYMLTGLSEGSHRVRVELHKNDHSSYNIGDVVNFEVNMTAEPVKGVESNDYTYMILGIIIVLFAAGFYFLRPHKKENVFTIRGKKSKK